MATRKVAANLLHDCRCRVAPVIRGVALVTFFLCSMQLPLKSAFSRTGKSSQPEQPPEFNNPDESAGLISPSTSRRLLHNPRWAARSAMRLCNVTRLSTWRFWLSVAFSEVVRFASGDVCWPWCPWRLQVFALPLFRCGMKPPHPVIKTSTGSVSLRVGNGCRD